MSSVRVVGRVFENIRNDWIRVHVGHDLPQVVP